MIRAVANGKRKHFAEDQKDQCKDGQVIGCVTGMDGTATAS